MNRSNGIKKTLIVLAVLILLLFTTSVFIYRLSRNPVARCYLVSWSDLDHVSPNLYLDTHMPEYERQELLANLIEAEGRIANLYGTLSGKPVILAGHTMDVMEKYGGNTYNRAGRTYLTRLASFVVLGPDGIQSPDIIAHELAHVEFSERVGHSNQARVPNWFVEGMAVQVDERYSEVEWLARTDNGRTAPNLKQEGVIEHDDWMAYATAKYEVKRWLDIVGKQGMLDLLQSIQEGQDFNQAYDTIEQLYLIGG